MSKIIKLITIIIWLIFFLILLLAIQDYRTLQLHKQELVTPIITYVKGTILDEEQKEFIQKINPFGVLLDGNNIASERQLKQLIKELKSLFPERKLYIAIDQEGGQVDRLKKIYDQEKLLKAAIYYGNLAELNLEQAKAEIYQDARYTAKILAELGFDINFAPMVDLAFFRQNLNLNSSNNGFAATQERAYSAKVEIVVALASLFIQAMEEQGIISVAKHMPGLGRAFADTHDNAAIIDAKYSDLLEQDFLVFKQIAKQVKMGMVGHGTYKVLDDQPASFSHIIIADIIRQKIGFEGLLISDALNMAAVANYELEERVAKSLEAGIDLVIPNYLSRAVSVRAIKAIKQEKLHQFNQKLRKLGYI